MPQKIANINNDINVSLFFIRQIFKAFSLIFILVKESSNADSKVPIRFPSQTIN